MNKNHKVVIIKIIIFLIIITTLIFFNSIRDKPFKLLNPELLDNQEIISIDHLKDTCPRGRSCVQPLCSLWSDLYNDGVCDRSSK
jgi:hypothetical protein